MRHRLAGARRAVGDNRSLAGLEPDDWHLETPETPHEATFQEAAPLPEATFQEAAPLPEATLQEAHSEAELHACHPAQAFIPCVLKRHGGAVTVIVLAVFLSCCGGILARLMWKAHEECGDGESPSVLGSLGLLFNKGFKKPQHEELPPVTNTGLDSRLAGYCLFDDENDVDDSQEASEPEQQAFRDEMQKLCKQISDSTCTGQGSNLFLKISMMQDPDLAQIPEKYTPSHLMPWRYSRLAWWTSRKSYRDRELPESTMAIYQVRTVIQSSEEPSKVQIQYSADRLSPAAQLGVKPKRKRKSTSLPPLHVNFEDEARADQFCEALDAFVQKLQEHFGDELVPSVPVVPSECVGGLPPIEEKPSLDSL